MALLSLRNEPVKLKPDINFVLFLVLSGSGFSTSVKLFPSTYLLTLISFSVVVLPFSVVVIIFVVMVESPTSFVSTTVVVVLLTFYPCEIAQAPRARTNRIVFFILNNFF